jgi:peptide/nickel transport system substrate-binding protein
MIRGCSAVLGLLMLLAGAAGAGAASDGILRITATGAMTTPNPYAESSTPMYSIWCQVYGCLGVYDYEKKTYVGVLADKWEVRDPNTWRFHLREDLKRQDGGPGPTSADVIHSYKRILEDPESAQRSYMESLQDIVAIDDHTFDIKTKQPNASLLSALFDRMIITSADIYKEFGRDADRKKPLGWGPYKLEEYTIDNRIVINRNDLWPGLDPRTAKKVIFQQINEPAQRIAALFAGEIQVARGIPPELVDRLKSRSDFHVVKTGSIEPMFVAMNPTFKPWDDVRVRQAVAHAIDRDLIIKRLLGGLAERLDGPFGPNQFCYNGPIKTTAYDPALSKKLLAEAGYQNGGPEIELFSANGRYISDRQVGTAVADMLTKVGFKVSLQFPEWANLWANIRAGKTPMFYMGRGSYIDPSDPFSQLFETGITPRIHYSNPEFDKLLHVAQAEFNDDKRCAIYRQAGVILTDDVPALFMWSHSLISGVRNGITFRADPSGEIWLATLRM